MVLEKTLESPLDCKEIQPVNPKDINPEYSVEGLMLKLKLQYFGHLIRRTDSLEKTLVLGKIEGRRRGQQMVGWHHQLDGHEFEQALGDGEGQGGLACYSLRSHKESDMTEPQLNNNKMGCRMHTSKGQKLQFLTILHYIMGPLSPLKTRKS